MPINITNLTALRRAPLYQGQPGASVATLYSVPGSPPTDVKVSEILLCNTTDAAATITVHAVPPAGTPGAANAILSALIVAPRGTVAVALNLFLTTGGVIAAAQGTATAITMTISGELYQ